MAVVLGSPHAHRIPAQSAQKWVSPALECIRFSMIFDDINYLFAKRRRFVSTYGFNVKHGESSLLTDPFADLAWILITAVMLLPPERQHEFTERI